jgi:hypothetical protein
MVPAVKATPEAANDSPRAKATAAANVITIFGLYAVPDAVAVVGTATETAELWAP